MTINIEKLIIINKGNDRGVLILYKNQSQEHPKKDTFYSNRRYNKMLKLTNKLQGERIKKNESKYIIN